MSQELISGFSATRQANNQPDTTFVWDAQESTGGLTVKVRYGDGTATDHSATALITTGSTTAVTLNPQQQDDFIVPIGKVQAAWSNDNRSYVVTFSGFMVRGGVNNIESSDQNGAPGDAAPIIVAATLAS